MKKNTKKTFLKILTILVSLSILIFVAWELYPTMKNLSTVEGRNAFKQEISNMGIKGVLILYLLEAVQMIFVILPGEPIEILYGMCYGSLGGAILLTLAVFINTIIVYALVKKYGRKLLVFFFSEDRIKKIENSKLLKKRSRIEYIIVLLFFLPGTPKDLLLYIGPLLPIEKKKFIAISTFVRFPSVITSTIAGSNIVEGNLWITIGIYILTAIIISIVMFLQKHKKKGKKEEYNEIIEDIMKM